MVYMFKPGQPCPDEECPKPGRFRSIFYRTKIWVCPICCYGWVKQKTRMVRSIEPIPFYRPGDRKARLLKILEK